MQDLFDYDTPNGTNSYTFLDVFKIASGAKDRARENVKMTLLQKTGGLAALLDLSDYNMFQSCPSNSPPILALLGQYVV